jgi:hypothetical protein
MSLGALRRHRHLPAAAALMSVLLYTVLVTSHVVSQATDRTLPSQGANAQPVVAGDPGCHDPLPSAGKANDSNRGLPASPAKKCPFCVGYAAFHISIVGEPVSILLDEAGTMHFACLGDGHLIAPASSHYWHSRAPPTFA